LAEGDGECADFSQPGPVPRRDEKLSQAILIWPPTRSLHLLVRGAVSHASHLNNRRPCYQHLATKVLARTVARCGVTPDLDSALTQAMNSGRPSCRDGGMHHKQVWAESPSGGDRAKSLSAVVAEVFLHDRGLMARPAAVPTPIV